MLGENMLFVTNLTRTNTCCSHVCKFFKFSLKFVWAGIFKHIGCFFFLKFCPFCTDVAVWRFGCQYIRLQRCNTSSQSQRWGHCRGNAIGHFRVLLSLHFKARLSAKSLLWKSVFMHIEIGTNYLDKNFELRLALKARLRENRKWPIHSSPQIFVNDRRLYRMYSMIEFTYIYLTNKEA